jgi:hypothetical protein
LIIIDEAAFMDEEQFLKNIMPMLTNDNRSLLAISTPGDENNWYSVLMSKCPDRVKTYSQQLSCERCRMRDNNEACTHTGDSIPSFKDPVIMELARILQPPHIHKQETLGIITANGNAIITKKEMDTIMALPRYEFTQNCQLVWVSVDPSAGSLDKSRYALSAMAINSDRQFVVRSS